MTVNLSETRPPRTDAELEDDLLAVAAKRLGVGLGKFLETGELPSSLEMGGGTLGDLTEARSDHYRRSFIAVYWPTEAEAAAALAWHTFCREHGYPTGEKAGATHNDAGEPYPEREWTSGEGDWVALKWPRVRAELRKRAPEPPTGAFDDETRAKARALLAAQDG